MTWLQIGLVVLGAALGIAVAVGQLIRKYQAEDEWETWLHEQMMKNREE